jgi:hypothetical protein
VPPRHLLMLAGLEHGQTIPFSDKRIEICCDAQLATMMW